ncbi:MAG: hypothetical protein KDA45_02465 [Planctomycetales bacterium]|nr:hypothetical protein [Planctomycetales bacterium]
MEAGQPGYASAPALESDQPLDTQIQDSWESWFDTQLQGRYRRAQGATELGQQFGELALRAYQEGAYAAPKAFLSSLSQEELEVVQRVHWLAEPIQVNGLSEEGALNLLIPPAAQIDLDRDGLTRSGAANTIRFPDSTTPSEVARAWEEATAGLSPDEQSLYVLQMKLPVLLANFVIDDNGAYVRHYEPGDPEWVNPMAAADYSYEKVASDYLGYLEAFKNQIDLRRYAQDTAFWSDLQHRLRAYRPAPAASTEPVPVPQQSLSQ